MTGGEFYADAIRGIVTETERNTFDRILEIIDDVTKTYKDSNGKTPWIPEEEIRRRILALKGGEE